MSVGASASGLAAGATSIGLAVVARTVSSVLTAAAATATVVSAAAVVVAGGLVLKPGGVRPLTSSCPKPISDPPSDSSPMVSSSSLVASSSSLVRQSGSLLSSSSSSPTAVPSSWLYCLAVLTYVTQLLQSFVYRYTRIIFCMRHHHARIIKNIETPPADSYKQHPDRRVKRSFLDLSTRYWVKSHDLNIKQSDSTTACKLNMCRPIAGPP